MLIEFLARAIKESCPLCRTTCDMQDCKYSMKQGNPCGPVAMWFDSHRAPKSNVSNNNRWAWEGQGNE
jgi:hypothetical protein